MAAPMATMLIGADVTAVRVVGASKGPDAGKLFAESFDAQIASVTDMKLKASAVEAVPQMVMCGAVEKPSDEGDGSADALTMAGTTAQPVSVPKVDLQVVASSAKLLTSKTTVQNSGVSQATQSVGAEMSSSAGFTKSTDVVPDGASGLLKEPDAEDVAAALRPAASTQVGPVKETAPPVQKVLPQPVAQEESLGSAKAVADALVQIDLVGSEKNSTDQKASAVKSSAEDAASVKKAKKQDSAKSSLPLKATEITKTSVGDAGFGGVVLAFTPGQAVVSVTGVAASPNVLDGKAQAVGGDALKNVTVPAAMVAKHSVQAVNAVKDDGSTKQTVGAAVKSSTGDSAAAAPRGDSSLLQKGDPATAKALTSSASAAGMSVAKAQSGDAVIATAVAAAHAGSGITASSINAAAASPAIHASVAAPQKGVDVSASVMASHASGGEASNAQMPTADGAHRTLVATPTVLEVGIPNGTQGWLKVRAELAGGSVNASVAAASSAGQEMLHRVLPALTAYLQQEKVALNSLVVHAPVGGAFRDLSGGLSGGSGGQMPGQGQSGSGRQSLSSANTALHDGVVVSDGDDVLTTIQNLRGGGWLSVRA